LKRAGAQCKQCGRWWYPSMYESDSYPGSACDAGECEEVDVDCPED
jgi:hypothetical protein